MQPSGDGCTLLGYRREQGPNESGRRPMASVYKQRVWREYNTRATDMSHAQRVLLGKCVGLMV